MSKVKMKENIDLFKCPICNSIMDMVELRSLICSQEHCFDLSKSGYVNFLLHPIKTEYDKALFQSRNIISKFGFFEPIVKAVSDIIKEHAEDTMYRENRVLDVGCGEGSHLSQIIEKLHQKTQANYIGIGMDIAKDGIQLASKAYKDCIWCVGDLARSPLADHKFDAILSILSPTNYMEFRRLLSNRGLLIKVVPGEHYLRELREAFFDKTEKQSYSNHNVIQHFRENFDLVDEKQVNYRIELDQQMLGHLIKMTPLSWGAAEEEVERAISKIKDGVTVNFTILCGI